MKLIKPRWVEVFKANGEKHIIQIEWWQVPKVVAGQIGMFKKANSFIFLMAWCYVFPKIVIKEWSVWVEDKKDE